MTVTVILEWAGTNWSAFAPDLDDVVVATGTTRDEAVDRFREALHGLAQAKRQDGKAFAEVTALDIRETLTLPEALAA